MSNTTTIPISIVIYSNAEHYPIHERENKTRLIHNPSCFLLNFIQKGLTHSVIKAITTESNKYGPIMGQRYYIFLSEIVVYYSLLISFCRVLVIQKVGGEELSLRAFVGY